MKHTYFITELLCRHGDGLDKFPINAKVKYAVHLLTHRPTYSCVCMGEGAFLSGNPGSLPICFALINAFSRTVSTQSSNDCAAKDIAISIYC